MDLFTELEIDALQEVMNISFGRAAADLAEVIDIFIKLNIPNIKIIKVKELAGYINSEIKDFDTCSIVEQNYHGDFSGIAFLIFPYGIEKEFISYFHDSHIREFESDELVELEKEVLMEVGNILIGACIGKIFELLNNSVTYLPPRAIIGDNFQDIFIKGHFHDNDVAITLKTYFSFEDRGVTGYMFLINNTDSLPYLKNALSKFLGP
jgi:chemotaxis protein CheC